MQLNSSQITTHLEKLPAGWKINDSRHLHKVFIFDNFLDPLALANKVAPIAEQMQHHPDMTISWGKLYIEIWTHDQNGLTEKDFQLATKIEAM